jgi:hypothetical protein
MRTVLRPVLSSVLPLIQPLNKVAHAAADATRRRPCDARSAVRGDQVFERAESDTRQLRRLRQTQDAIYTAGHRARRRSNGIGFGGGHCAHRCWPALEAPRPASASAIPRPPQEAVKQA